MSATVERYAERMEDLRDREADIQVALDTSNLTREQTRELEEELQAVNSTATRLQFGLHDYFDASARLEGFRKLLAGLEEAEATLRRAGDDLSRGDLSPVAIPELEHVLRDRLARVRRRIEILEENERRALAKLEAVEGKAQAA